MARGNELEPVRRTFEGALAALANHPGEITDKVVDYYMYGIGSIDNIDDDTNSLRKLALPALGMATVIGTLAMPSRADAAPTPQQTDTLPAPKVLFIGDSITVGREEAGHLTEAFTAAGIDIVADFHGARPLIFGACAHGLTDHCESGSVNNGKAPGDTRAALMRHPDADFDVVVLSLGTNDKVDVFEANAEAAIREIDAAGSTDGKRPLILWPEMIYPGSYAGGKAGKNEIAHNLATRLQAEGIKIQVMPYDSAGIQHADDGVHPHWQAYDDLVGLDLENIVPLAIQERDKNHAPPPPPAPIVPVPEIQLIDETVIPNILPATTDTDLELDVVGPIDIQTWDIAPPDAVSTGVTVEPESISSSVIARRNGLTSSGSVQQDIIEIADDLIESLDLSPEAEALTAEDSATQTQVLSRRNSSGREMQIETVDETPASQTETTDEITTRAAELGIFYQDGKPRQYFNGFTNPGQIETVQVNEGYQDKRTLDGRTWRQTNIDFSSDMDGDGKGDNADYIAGLTGIAHVVETSSEGVKIYIELGVSERTGLPWVMYGTHFANSKVQTGDLVKVGDLLSQANHEGIATGNHFSLGIADGLSLDQLEEYPDLDQSANLINFAPNLKYVCTDDAVSDSTEVCGPSTPDGFLSLPVNEQALQALGLPREYRPESASAQSEEPELAVQALSNDIDFDLIDFDLDIDRTGADPAVTVEQEVPARLRTSVSGSARMPGVVEVEFADENIDVSSDGNSTNGQPASTTEQRPDPAGLRGLFTISETGVVDDGPLQSWVRSNFGVAAPSETFPEGEFVRFPDSIPGLNYSISGGTTANERFISVKAAALQIILIQKANELGETPKLMDMTSDHEEHSAGFDFDFGLLSTQENREALLLFSLSLRDPVSAPYKDGDEYFRHIVTGDPRLKEIGDKFLAEHGYNRPNIILQTNHGKTPSDSNHSHYSIDGGKSGPHGQSFSRVKLNDSRPQAPLIASEYAGQVPMVSVDVPAAAAPEVSNGNAIGRRGAEFDLNDFDLSAPPSAGFSEGDATVEPTIPTNQQNNGRGNDDKEVIVDIGDVIDEEWRGELIGAEDEGVEVDTTGNSNKKDNQDEPEESEVPAEAEAPATPAPAEPTAAPAPPPPPAPAEQQVPLRDIFTNEVAKATMPGASDDAINRNLPLLLNAFAKHGLADKEMVCYALATAHVEVETFKPRHEGEESQKMHDSGQWYGRGIIQITGKDNYIRIGNVLGMDLVNNPDRAMDDDVWPETFAIYYKDREAKIREAFANGDLKKLRQLVNGERAYHLDKFVAAWNSCAALIFG